MPDYAIAEEILQERCWSQQSLSFASSATKNWVKNLINFSNKHISLKVFAATEFNKIFSGRQPLHTLTRLSTQKDGIEFHRIVTPKNNSPTILFRSTAKEKPCFGAIQGFLCNLCGFSALQILHFYLWYTQSSRLMPSRYRIAQHTNICTHRNLKPVAILHSYILNLDLKLMEIFELLALMFSTPTCHKYNPLTAFL